jgi:CRP-like cAMP-binding protein/sugar phosphate permease
MTNAIPASPSPFAVFRNRNFSLLWTGQLVETIGNALTSIAASIYVYRQTDSALSVGLMLMATSAPSLLVGLFAGVFVDRYDRKNIMISADVLRAILVVLIPILVPLSVVWLYVIVMLISAIGQFFDPAHESILPEVASDDELAAANSLIAISSFGSTAVGFAAAGLIASAANINWTFYINAATFLFSAVCVYLIRVKPSSAEEDTSVAIVIQNLKAGVRQLFDTPVLRSLFTAQVPVLIAFGLSNALLLPFAIRALNASEFEYGIQEGMTSIGFVVGSLLMANIFDRMREGVWIAVSYLGMAVMGIIYSMLYSIPLAILFITISGFFNAPSSIGRRVVVQRNTPREMRGRVNSVFFVARDVLFLIGMGAAGLADAFDVRPMYLVSALILLLGGILVIVLPGLRQEGAEWRQSLRLLRTAPSASGLGTGRSATLSDMDTLVGLLPSLSALSSKEREGLLNQARILEASAETTLLRHGETGDAAYFIISGKAVAGIPSEEGSLRSLSTMMAGDFFGEIAALTGTVRTADVVASEPTTLMKVPAQALRSLMSNPAVGAIFLAKMTERLNRSSINELPRFAGHDQQVMRDLRTAPAEG